MDQRLSDLLSENSVKFKTSMMRIIEKYSNLSNEGEEVDIGNIKYGTLEHYMDMSRNKLETELDSTCEVDAGDKTCASTSLLAADESEEAENSAEASRSRFLEFQPEDQDEVLQMSLSSHGSSLGELYPGMIRRMERAWDLQNASVAASSVLRKYRRWRLQPKRSVLNSTFDVTLKHTNGGSKKMTSKALIKRNYSSLGKKQLSLRSETNPSPVLQTIINLHNGQAQQQSPRKERGLQKREQPYVCVMDFSDTFKPKVLLNDTFTVSTLSPPKAACLEEKVSVFTDRPSCLPCAAARASVDPSFKIRGVSVPSHLAQTTMCPTYAPESPTIEERPDFFGSPVRRSPFKVKMGTSLSRSPHAFPRSPRQDYVEYYSRSSLRPKLQSTSLPSSPVRSVVQPWLLHPQDSHPSTQPRFRSPYSARVADSDHKLRRHLSFESAQLPKPIFYSPKKIDEDLMKLYHKFVCQNKSDFLNGPPCRLCARRSEASRGHSSSTLAALALSPHRSLLRKRHRESGEDAYSCSKRRKEEHSPWSSRHRTQMLRQRFSEFPFESPHGSIFSSPSKYRRQQPPAHQEAWTSRHQPARGDAGLGV